MKHSIRIKILTIFVLLSALILSAIWIANNWLLEKYYIQEKVKTLEEEYNSIDKYIIENDIIGNTDDNSDEYTELKNILREFSEKYNATVVIIDSVNSKAILSSAREGEYMMQKMQQYILGQVSPEQSETLEIHDNYTVQKNYDVKNKSYYLESWGYFSDNTTAYIISTPLASMKDNVALANRFLGYVAIIALICSSILMYFTSRMITGPIMELAKLSEKMSGLDFDAKYDGNAKDEIGILGKSMNTLSDKLKNTIGELKSANNELQRDIEKKQEIDDMRKEFIANVSHELKTPIALIQGYAEGLDSGMCEDEEKRKYYCNVIIDEADKMNTMVKQLLNLSSLEAGSNSLSMERFNIVELIKGIINASDVLIKQKEAVITFSESEPVYVWADEFKIEEVVTNYLSNALNHLDGDRNIIISLDKKEDKVRVSVYNDGNFISDEEQPKLWNKFYKVDKAHTHSYGGSGIGLSIVKAIMDAHSQKYGVNNKEHGVEFWFELDSKNI